MDSKIPDLSETVANEAGLPEDLEAMLPGPELGRLLAGIELDRLDGFDRVIVLQAHARQVAHYQALFHRAIVAIGESIGNLYPDDDLQESFDTTASEVRAALHLTRRAADHQVDFANQLCERLPAVWEALHAGTIDLARAKVLAQETSHLPRQEAREIAETALDRAPDQTTGQLRARIARLFILNDPDAARYRYQQATEERRVVMSNGEDGTATLTGHCLPVDRTAAVMRRINRIARAARTAEDPRTMDQIRADVFLDLLGGKATAARNGTLGHQRALVDIRVDLTTLIGLDDNPAEIPGWGPVIADVARQVIDAQPDARWQVTVTDQRGTPLTVANTRRRPSASQTRAIQTRNPICVFPGCRMPSTEADLDHHHAYADGGLTVESNLGPLCRHDHILKHQHGWQMTQLSPGLYRWISPLGHGYTTRPQPP